MATKQLKPKPNQKMTYKIVAGRKTRFVTAPPDQIQAAVDKAIAEMTKDA